MLVTLTAKGQGSNRNNKQHRPLAGAENRTLACPLGPWKGYLMPLSFISTDGFGKPQKQWVNAVPHWKREHKLSQAFGHQYGHHRLWRGFPHYYCHSTSTMYIPHLLRTMYENYSTCGMNGTMGAGGGLITPARRAIESRCCWLRKTHPHSLRMRPLVTYSCPSGWPHASWVSITKVFKGHDPRRQERCAAVQGIGGRDW